MRDLSLRRRPLWSLISSIFLLAPAQAQNSAPAKAPELQQTREIGSFLSQCVQHRMAGQNHVGLREVTFSLSFRSNGTLFGLPMRTYSFPSIVGKQQELFVHEVHAALIKCAPLPFSKALGEAIAGRQFRYRHTIKPKQDIRL